VLNGARVEAGSYRRDSWVALSQQVATVIAVPPAPTKSLLRQLAEVALVIGVVASVVVGLRVGTGNRSSTTLAVWAAFVAVYVSGRLIAERVNWA
jgi:hypothetical protein